VIEICSSDVPGGVSIIKKSSSPQFTSVKNYLISPFFLGPLHTTASFSSPNKNPIDITPRLSFTYTGDHPSLLVCTSFFYNPNILGIEGPQISISINPTSNPFLANKNAIYEDTVLLPTPPLPENTNILCLISAIFFSIFSKLGSFYYIFPVEQAYYIGHPSQLLAFPAYSDLTPGHP